MHFAMNISLPDQSEVIQWLVVLIKTFSNFIRKYIHILVLKMKFALLMCTATFRKCTPELEQDHLDNLETNH